MAKPNKKKKMSAVIQKLKEWRKRNSLSQKQAIDVMAVRQFKFAYSTLVKYEGGFSSPDRFTAEAIERFLYQYPVIDDAPNYGRQTDPLPAEKVEQIKALRAQDLDMKTIGEQLGISESSVSRILGGKRRARPSH
jgi:transcriptional regulator with XRE-family HTH domain